MLDIAYRKRETFAYACEAYACILAAGKSLPERRERAEMYSKQCREYVTDERVDTEEVAEIVREAVEVRNGWKIILARCAPPREPAANTWSLSAVSLSCRSTS